MSGSRTVHRVDLLGRPQLVVPIVVAFLVGACGTPSDASPPTDAGPSASIAAILSPTPPAPSPTASEATGDDAPVVSPETMASNTTPHPVRAISAGWGICAIREDATIGCWNDLQRPPEGRFVAIDSNDGSTCAIREDGSLACWGEIGTKPPDGDFRAVSVAQAGACAIRRSDDRLTCWSAPGDPEDDEDEDQVGLPDSVEPPEGPVKAVSMGDLFDCAILESGRLVCWASLAEDIPPLPDERYLALDLPCAILEDGGLQCLATDNESGSVPPTEGTYTAVSVGPYGAGCALRQDRTLTCWGDEGDDEAGTTLSMRTPPGEYVSVSVGEMLACATRPDGFAVCWGDDDEGVRPAPTMRFMAPVFVTDRQIPLRWDALPAFGPIAGYDIDEEIWSGEEDELAIIEPWRVATPTTEGVFEGTPGETHCWQARAHDTDGRISGWAGDCTTLPHDETAFQPSGDWSTVRDPRYYLGSALRTTERGATLTIDVDAFGLAILATTCPDCGSFRVVAGHDDEGREVDLKTNGRHDRAVVWHWDNGQEGFFAEEGYGHVVLEVTSNGKPVIIDGILQGPSLDEEG